jgi:zinc transporter ZupT
MVYVLPLLSVLLGFGFALWFTPKSKKQLKLLLAFSGAFLLSITVLHLLPEIYETGKQHVGIFIILGILLQILLEYFSQGAEHGHVHKHGDMQHIPWLLFGSLCLHAFLEGIPISNHNPLAMGIAIHHLPIAVILTTFFLQSNLNKGSVTLFMLIFSVMTPLGTYLAVYIPQLHQYQAKLTAIVIGILFHISSTIIFESNEGHKFNIAKISMIILGVLLAYFL